MGRVGMQTAPASTMRRAQTVAKIGRRIKKSTNKVTSDGGDGPGRNERRCGGKLRSAGRARDSDSAQRLDWRTLLQKLQAGGDDFVTRLKPADHGIGVADGIAQFDGHLMGDISVALWSRKINEGLAAHKTDSEDGNHRRGCGAPGDARTDQLLVAKQFGAAGNFCLG